jgi:aminopeptidase N
MTALAPIPLAGENLPGLIDRAATMLASAKTAAEVLEAREAAGLAYDVAKRAARLKSAKAAHDDLVAAAHRAQADALEIEAAAKRRLADEYDAAQARGEVAKRGWESGVDKHNITTSADLGLRRDQIHDARLIRDAEVADPGLVRRTLDAKLERGEEPTRSAVRRAAEDRLQRSLDRLQRIQESVKRLEEHRAPPLTPEQRARQIAVFGTQEDRAICGRIEEIIERIDEQPAPLEAVRRVPPASRHAVDTAPIRRAAAWLTDFSTLYEQEVQNGTYATE